MNTEIKQILEGVKNGDITVDEALLKIKKEPFEDIGYAKVDLHRSARQGVSEVIYGASKTAEQMLGIIESMLKNGQEKILITRLSKESSDIINKSYELKYFEDAHIGIIGDMPTAGGIGKVVVATGGTSDIPVAEEAALTLEFLGNEVVRLYDVGVAGLHRLLSHMEEIMEASVIVAIAGMEGALASVIGGLSDCPVIAVPTSIGYGASFNGLSALLSMLNSCASGICEAHMDDGVCIINELICTFPEERDIIAASVGASLGAESAVYYLPSDSVIADKFANDANTQIVPSNAVPDGWESMDCGPESCKMLRDVIMSSKTILWNGPAGVFEFDNFTGGSRAIAEAIAKATAEGAYSLIGGGDSVACVNKFGLADQVSYISTGGGALLEAIEGKVLPGVAAIKG